MNMVFKKCQTCVEHLTSDELPMSTNLLSLNLLDRMQSCSEEETGVLQYHKISSFSPPRGT